MVEWTTPFINGITITIPTPKTGLHHRQAPLSSFPVQPLLNYIKWK